MSRDTRFRPGVSGNPSGRPKIAKFRRAALKALRQEIASETTRLDCVTDAIITKAESGDVGAYAVLRDTVDGKPGSDSTSSVQVGIAIAVEFIDK